MTNKWGVWCGCLCLLAHSGLALALEPKYAPGAEGLGDPYFPLDGNGGYDVEHYRLEVRYEPGNNRLIGRATIEARATQALSQLNLDFVGLELTSVEISGVAAGWSRDEGELTLQPRRGLHEGEVFDVVLEYEGVPSPLPELSGSGFLHTSDGAVIVGEPHVAATWFPANDHPSDRASFTFELTVPEGLEAVANGVLVSSRSHEGWTTWVWEAAEPMTTYLAGVAIGELALSEYEVDGIRYWDAVAETLVGAVTRPSSGTRLLSSGEANLSYKRLGRVIAVPAQGAELSFTVTRRTESFYDYFFVEAHTPGADDWTTLPDTLGHTFQDASSACSALLVQHPALTSYLTAGTFRYEPCLPLGSSGEWWAATGDSEDVERWTIDLSPYAGSEVEVSLSYVSDDIEQGLGVFIDDIVVSTGEGNSSFEDDGDPLDGWRALGAPPGSQRNPNDWTVVGAAEVPTNPIGPVIRESLARQPEIIAFLEQFFGAYPFEAVGAIIPAAPIYFALENQTRPIYSSVFFSSLSSGSNVLVHELTHQWFGDSLSVSNWQHVWLNEGFATYAEWLWAEHEGDWGPDELFESWMTIDASDPFWSITIGDPGPEALFDFTVYYRGALTLQALRRRVGDAPFFDILRQWATSRAGQSVATEDFIALAERVSQQDLRALFDAWLFTPTKPGGAL